MEFPASKSTELKHNEIFVVPLMRPRLFSSHFLYLVLIVIKFWVTQDLNKEKFFSFATPPCGLVQRS
jgi:hypothetical protein